MTKTNFPKSIIIIGAPRSGTNILRDTLNSIDGIGTWPCDEIPYVWKNRNLHYPYDDLVETHATESVQEFIRNSFIARAKKAKCKVIVEKTCSNSLRVGFVDKVVPEAIYVFLVRNGEDAVRSATKQWIVPESGLKYYLKKARYMRPFDVPAVVRNVVKKRYMTKRTTGGNSSWGVWGPNFAELESAVMDGLQLYDLSALQWSQCIKESVAQLNSIDQKRRLSVTYEKLISEPESVIAEILKHAGVSESHGNIARACTGIRRSENPSHEFTRIGNADMLNATAVLEQYLLEEKDA